MKVINTTKWPEIDITVKLLPNPYDNNISYECYCGMMYLDVYLEAWMISKTYRVCKNCGKEMLFCLERDLYERV